MAPKAKFKPIEVAWVDSEHESDWKKLADILEDQSSLECHSCGYLISDTEDRIILATSISAADDIEEQISAYIIIPKAAILWQRDLRKK